MATISQHFKAQKGSKSTSSKAKKDAKTLHVTSSSSASQDVAAKSDMETLRQFDLNWEFGPCTGITRMERWNRAEKHGLNPPVEVKDLISKHTEDESYTECIWKGFDI